MIEITGLPFGLAARRFGVDPIEWAAHCELRAQVVSGLDEQPAPDTASTPPVWRPPAPGRVV